MYYIYNRLGLSELELIEERTGKSVFKLNNIEVEVSISELSDTEELAILKYYKVQEQDILNNIKKLERKILEHRIKIEKLQEECKSVFNNPENLL